jgi:hypothetical protein
MSAQPILRKASWMSARRSYRTLSLLKRFSHECVRSTTQRCRPSRSLDSMPLRAIRGVMPRWRKTALFFFESYPLSACNLSGRLRGRPRGSLIGSMASSVDSSIVVSLTLAAVNTIASGTPWRSTTRWRFVPCLPRSVGFGPVFSPPLERVLSRHQWRLGSSRCDRLGRADLARPGGGGPRHQTFASLEDDASRSCHCHSPALWGASPRGCRCGGRRGCLPRLHDRTREGDHLSALACLGVTKVPHAAIEFRRQVRSYGVKG